MSFVSSYFKTSMIVNNISLSSTNSKCFFYAIFWFFRSSKVQWIFSNKMQKRLLMKPNSSLDSIIVWPKNILLINTFYLNDILMTWLWL